MFAKIYQPSKTAMQSGRAKTRQWVLEFDRSGPKSIDPLTGYVSTSDMRSQLDLTFDTKEQAVAYAQANNIPFRVVESKPVQRISRSYSENFAYDRRQPWTH